MISILTSVGDYFRAELNTYVKSVSSKFNDWDIRYYIDDLLARAPKTREEKAARKAGSPWLVFDSDIQKSQQLLSGELIDGDLEDVYTDKLTLSIKATLICVFGEINAKKPEMRWRLLNKIRELSTVNQDLTGYAFDYLRLVGKMDLTGRILDFEEPFEHHFDFNLTVQGRVELARIARAEQKFDKLSGGIQS